MKNNPKRLLLSLLSAAALCLLGWQSLRIGYARSLARVAIATVNVGWANQAASAASADAETLSTRGDVLEETGDYPGASAAFDAAVRLRPRDYYLWIELGQARERDGDQEGAARALKQAVVLAPFYANAHWQLGNLLFRMGDFDGAFPELKRAATSNPTLLPATIDLAWGIYRHDSNAVRAVIKPSTDSEHLALAQVFANYGDFASAEKEFLVTSVPDKQEGEKLVGRLLDSKAFDQAYHVWARLRGVPANNDNSGVIHDGGFEEPLLLSDRGFGWQISPGLVNVVMSVDEGIHQQGARSLRIEFRGNSAPQGALLTEIVRVKPDTHYRLILFARGQQLVSAALPVVSIRDASSPASPSLAESTPVRSDSGDWQEIATELNTGTETHAIILTVTRQACANDPCPAFGTVWFDGFSLSPAGRSAPIPGVKKIDASGRS